MFNKKTVPEKDKVPEYYTGERTKILLAHITQGRNKEVTKPIKAKVYSQEIKWKNRQWSLIGQESRFITDNKGINHVYLDVNDSAVLTLHKDHTDTCKKCGGKMTIDAMSNKQMNRKKIVTAIWGLDNTHIMLLLIMGIVTLILGVVIMYMYGDNQQAHATITALQLQIHPSVVTNPDGSTTTTNPDGSIVRSIPSK